MKNNEFLLIEIEKTKKDFLRLLQKLKDNAQITYDDYTQEDARCGFFVVSYNHVLWLMINFDQYLELLKNKKILDKYSNMKEVGYQQYLLSHNNYNRMSFLTRMMFEVENYMKNILTELNNPINSGFFQLSKNYLIKLNLYSDQRHKILNFPAQLRNSLHAGGFTEFSIDVEIGVNHFKANRGERITFANLDTIYLSIDALFDLIIDSLKSLKDLKLIQSNYVKLWKSDPFT